MSVNNENGCLQPRQRHSRPVRKGHLGYWGQYRSGERKRTPAVCVGTPESLSTAYFVVSSKHNPSEIYLAARTPSKAEAAIAEIKKQVPNAKITFLHLDLASLDSVKRAADTFTNSSDRLDILMNNAGIMACPPALTKDGYETQFGTNHMGHALFTKLLLPTLQRMAKEPGSDVRIINLSSIGHNLAPNGGIIFDKLKTDMKDYNAFPRYGQSKLANILFNRELAKRYPSIECVAIHPGGVRSKQINVLSI